MDGSDLSSDCEYLIEEESDHDFPKDEEYTKMDISESDSDDDDKGSTTADVTKFIEQDYGEMKLDISSFLEEDEKKQDEEDENLYTAQKPSQTSDGSLYVSTCKAVKISSQDFDACFDLFKNCYESICTEATKKKIGDITPEDRLPMWGEDPDKGLLFMYRSILVEASSVDKKKLWDSLRDRIVKKYSDIKIEIYKEDKKAGAIFCVISFVFASKEGGLSSFLSSKKKPSPTKKKDPLSITPTKQPQQNITLSDIAVLSKDDKLKKGIHAELESQVAERIGGSVKRNSTIQNPSAQKYAISKLKAIEKLLREKAISCVENNDDDFTLHADLIKSITDPNINYFHILVRKTDTKEDISCPFTFNKMDNTSASKARIQFCSGNPSKSNPPMFCFTNRNLAPILSALRMVTNISSFIEEHFPKAAIAAASLSKKNTNDKNLIYKKAIKNIEYDMENHIPVIFQTIVTVSEFVC